MLSSPVPQVTAVARALQDARSAYLSEEERRFIECVEMRRRELLASKAEIEVHDFGAGAPGEVRTPEEMRKGVRSKAPLAKVCAVASKSPAWGAILFRFIRHLRPSSCVELGTCVGLSAAYQAGALRFNGQGNLLSLEGSPGVAAVAMETFNLLGLQNARVSVGPFHETYIHALESMRPVDFLFNDGHHDHDAVVNYFLQSLPYLADTAVMVVDDIAWSVGMKQAWREMIGHPQVVVSVDMRTVGVLVLSGPDVLADRRQFQVGVA